MPDQVPAAWDDPIMADVRAARAALLAAAGGDADALARQLAERERSSGRRVVSLPPRRPASGTDSGAAA